MRALQLETYDGPEALRVTEVPEPAAGDDVVIDVRAIGINFPDYLITTGQYQHKPPLPFVPGCEVSGVVRSAPAGSGWEAGDRVAAFVWTGGYAEQVAAPARSVYRLPDSMDFLTGAATIVNYHTVHFGLSRRGRLAAGEKLLVLGAAGGIGTAAVQVGKGLGAHVIGGVADPGQVDAATRAGADEVIVLAEGFSAAVRELTDGYGVDVVLDPLGDWVFGEAVRALAPEGRILVVGFAAGEIPTLRVNRLLLKNIDAVGVAWGAFLDIDDQLIAKASRDIGEMFERGVVAPIIAGNFRFDQIPEALGHLSRGEIQGKGVIDLSQG